MRSAQPRSEFEARLDQRQPAERKCKHRQQIGIGTEQGLVDHEL